MFIAVKYYNNLGIAIKNNKSIDLSPFYMLICINRIYGDCF